ncbi:MAG: hybrid sensor histidine kinase/response regulator, partial [Bacteroidota bacterium]
LREQGFEAEEAASGKEGIEKALALLPDVIVSDINMPGMDGFAMLDHLRLDPSTAAIPFIFLTGFHDRSHVRQGMNRGADDYLTKPVGSEDLVRAIETRLQKHHRFLQQAEQKLDELRANITLALPHELRTPLHGILGFADIMATTWKGLSPEEMGEMAGHIHGSAQRLQHSLENFLIYAQIEMLAADPEKVRNIRTEQIHGAEAVVAILARQKATKVGREDDLQLHLQPFNACVSQKYLTRMADELLDNAFKFSQAGSLVVVTSGSNNGNAFITITDRGRGMTAEEISKIGGYMQFNRKVYEQQGSGLGLVIAKRLAELHGGSLSIRSIPGEGSSITVEIPHSC